MPLPTREFTVEVAQAQLSELVERAKAGETVILSDHGVPVAQLQPLITSDQKRVRILGAMRGTVIFKDDVIAPIDVPWESQ